jgi:hypothetical protein
MYKMNWYRESKIIMIIYWTALIIGLMMLICGMASLICSFIELGMTCGG